MGYERRWQRIDAGNGWPQRAEPPARTTALAPCVNGPSKIPSGGDGPRRVLGWLRYSTACNDPDRCVFHRADAVSVATPTADFDLAESILPEKRRGTPILGVLTSPSGSARRAAACVRICYRRRNTRSPAIAPARARHPRRPDCHHDGQRRALLSVAWATDPDPASVSVYVGHSVDPSHHRTTSSPT